MVAVAQHHGMDIIVEAGVDDSRIVVRILLCAPAVEGFVDNEHADGIAGIEEGTGRGIVRGADEVETCLLHLAYLADFSIVESPCAQYTIIMMYAGAIDEHRLAVKNEAALCIK